MSCRWPTAATTKTIASQQGANPEGAGNGTNSVEWAIVVIRNSSADVEMSHSLAGLGTLTRHSLSDLDLTWTKSRFYERAVKIKHFTADRPTGRKPIVAASPASVETNDFNQLCGHSAPHHNVMSSSETEKQCGGDDRRPRFY